MKREITQQQRTGVLSRYRSKYVEISKASITPTRNMVISSSEDITGKKSYILSQQITVQEDGRTTQVFLKGSGIIVDDLKGLYNIRDAVNFAVNKAEKEKPTFQYTDVNDDSIEWDDN